MTTVQRPGKIIAIKGEKQVSKVTSAVNAIGLALPPLFIFLRKRVSDLMKLGVLLASEFCSHESGWMTAENFENFFGPLHKILKIIH